MSVEILSMPIVNLCCAEAVAKCWLNEGGTPI